MYRMFKAIRRIIDKYDDVKMVYPVHLNPLVVKAANEVFGDSEKIKLIKPLEVVEFHNLLADILSYRQWRNSGRSTLPWKTSYCFTRYNGTSRGDRCWNFKTCRDGRRDNLSNGR